MTKHKALHFRDVVDRQYVTTKEGRGLSSIQDSVDESIQRLEDYIKNAEGDGYSHQKNTNGSSINRRKLTRKQKREKNNCMHISSDKQAKSPTRKLRCG